MPAGSGASPRAIEPLRSRASTRSSASARFVAWLLRPYIDLGPFAVGPLYARGVEEYWRAFSDLRLPPFALQRTLPPAFRLQLLSECDHPEFLVGDPREVADQRRTQRWAALCDAVSHWKRLPLESQRRLVRVLHSLCLYEAVLRLMAKPPTRRGDSELRYWRASAEYVLGSPSRMADYRNADMSVFEAIVSETPEAVPAAFNAAVKVFVHRAKTGSAELASWGARLRQVLDATVKKVDRFAADLYTSRYYRAAAFLPQQAKDRREVVRLMNLAEQHALAMKPATPAQELIYLENLHPLMESRTKEALWLGKKNLALARARKVVDLDPYDSKAWAELGEVRVKRKEWAQAAQAYVAAAMLGAPASAIGRHMAGACFKRSGQDFLAAFFLKDALEIDPQGISPHHEIGTLANEPVLRALKEWSLSAFDLKAGLAAT